MKWFPLFAVFILTAFVFASCSKEKDNRIDLSLESISLLAGFDGVIKINGTASSYKVYSENEQVAKATVNNNNEILITTTNIGETIIQVTDEANRINIIQVQATSVTGAWRQAGLNNEALIETDIQSDDAAFSETLKLSFQDTATKLGRARFTINFSGSASGTFIEAQGTTTVREGTYTYGNLQLVLKVNGIEEIYTLKKFSSGAFVMNRDYTEYFKNIYPGKGIKKVVLGLVLGKALFY
jgi:hypothetical protein